MFTGIIQAIGKIISATGSNKDARLCVGVGAGKMSLDDVEIGESISINGACMTVVEFDSHSFSVDISRESLAMTTLGQLRSGSAVNLERAMCLSDRLGGHLVSGHVDGVGQIVQREPEGRSVKFGIRVPEDLSKYIAHKGSVCIDGVSLTANEVKSNDFSLQIIPHTMQETIFSGYSVSDEVNIEVDIIARYLERLLMTDEEHSGLTIERLIKAGFK